MSHWISRLAVLGLLLLSTVASANQTRHASVYERIDVNEIPALLYGMGIQASKDFDSIGYPMYSFTLSGYHVQLYTYDCQTDGCGGLQLRAGFSMEKPPSLKTINDWNVNSAWSRAYLDLYTDPVIESNLALYGGVAPEAIQSWVTQFTEFLPDFTRHIGF